MYRVFHQKGTCCFRLVWGFLEIAPTSVLTSLLYWLGLKLLLHKTLCLNQVSNPSAQKKKTQQKHGTWAGFSSGPEWRIEGFQAAAVLKYENWGGLWSCRRALGLIDLLVGSTIIPNSDVRRNAGALFKKVPEQCQNSKYDSGRRVWHFSLSCCSWSIVLNISIKLYRSKLNLEWMNSRTIDIVTIK